MNTIYDIEKIYFSNFHSIFNKLLNILNLNKKNIKKNKNILIKIIELNSKMNEIELLINDIIVDITKNNNDFDTDSIILLDDYNKDKSTINAFLPYMFLYRMKLDN
jgi:hypothetical protein